MTNRYKKYIIRLVVLSILVITASCYRKSDLQFFSDVFRIKLPKTVESIILTKESLNVYLFSLKKSDLDSFLSQSHEGYSEWEELGQNRFFGADDLLIDGFIQPNLLFIQTHDRLRFRVILVDLKTNSITGLVIGD
jgi:hypothetical protein